VPRARAEARTETRGPRVSLRVRGLVLVLLRRRRLRAGEQRIALARLPPGFPALDRFLARGFFRARVELEVLVRRLDQRLRAQRARERALVAEAGDQRRHRLVVAEPDQGARALVAEIGAPARRERDRVDVLDEARVARRAQRGVGG